MKEKEVKQFCPLIEKSYNYCYCTILNSQSIMSAIYYCGNNFRECRIYQESHVSEKIETDVSEV